VEKRRRIGERKRKMYEQATNVASAAILCALVIPNKPESVRWLTPVERDMLLYRLGMDRGTKDENDQVSIGQAFKMAVMDVSNNCSSLMFTFADGFNF
jgi:hypothetical protein